MTLQGREEIGSHRGLCRKVGAYPHGVFLELMTPDHGQLMAPPVLLKTKNPKPKQTGQCDCGLGFESLKATSSWAALEMQDHR